MEEITTFIKDELLSWGLSQSWADSFTKAIILVFILAIAFLCDAVCRHVILKVVAKLVKQTKATWDDIVFDRKVMIYVSHMVAPVVLYLLLPLQSLQQFLQDCCRL